MTFVTPVRLMVRIFVTVGGCEVRNLPHCSRDRSGAIVARVQRRYAILEDNQRRLEERLASLRVVLPALLVGRMAAAMVIGSVARGKARDASDIDLVVVLREGSPTRADYGWWEAEVAPHLFHRQGFPVQPVIIGREALATAELHLREALATGMRLWDPEGIFDDQPQARS